jgi:hypothetical protein
VALLRQLIGECCAPRPATYLSHKLL